MTVADTLGAAVVTGAERPLWFLGTLVRPKLMGEQTGGRFALWEGTLPRGAAPPLHSHPQDETFYVLEGELTFWVVERELAQDRRWVETHARHCSAGAAAFRVESDTARLLFLSTPAGIDDYVRALAQPAQWPWLQPPPDGPRVPPERLEAVDREHDVIRLSPAPPAAGKEEA
jgi:hypothetical protein